MKSKNKIRKTREDYIVDFIVYFIAIVVAISIILPFMQVITISMSPAHVVNRNGFHLIPHEFDFSGYTKIMSDDNFWHSYLNTIIRAVVGTLLSVTVTVLTAYPL